MEHTARVNRMAIAALIFAVVLPPFGILMGHIAWSESRRLRQRGRGLALAALIIGYLELIILCGVPIALFGF